MSERVQERGVEKPIGRMRRRPATIRYRTTETWVCCAGTTSWEARAKDAIRMPQAITKHTDAPVFAIWLLKPVNFDAA